MASSQVEFASSSPTFGGVLRDRNHRDRRRETNARAAHAAFEKNLKDLVRDHFHACISISTASPAPTGESDSDENSHRSNRNGWVGDEQRNNRRSIRHANSNNIINNTGETSAVNPRRSRILDRWAARRAREMITTIERQSHEAELLALSNTHAVSSRASAFLREPSPAPSDSSIDIPNLGASSLVRRWKDLETETRLNDSKIFNSNSGTATSRTQSGEGIAENAPPVTEPPRVSEACDSMDEGDEDHGNNEESFTDWESDRTVPSEPPFFSQGPDLDAGEQERIRVAEIVRRLTSGSRTRSSSTYWSDDNDNEANESLPRENSDQTEQRILLHRVNSPRIRGRQAIIDLLMQMERDRQRELDELVERQAVSRFSHRGRIQSLLRLRFLHHVTSARDQSNPRLQASESRERLRQRSSITLLRERFSRADHGDVRAIRTGGNSRSPRREVVNSTVARDNHCTSSHFIEGAHQPEIITVEQQSTPSVQHSGAHATEDLHVEVRGCSVVMWQETSSNLSNPDSRESPDTPSSLNSWEENVISEEQEGYNQQLVETNSGLLSGIYRSQRDWEDLRQARYREMLDRTSENEDIRKLLERRTVSSFLESDFRVRMDQLMVSLLQRQAHVVRNQEDEERGGPGGGGGVGAGEVAVEGDNDNHEEVEVEDEDDEDEEEEEEDDDDDDDEGEEDLEEEEAEQEEELDEEEEEGAEQEEELDEEDFLDEENPMRHQYYNAGDYYGQPASSMRVPLSSLWRSWSDYQELEASDPSNQFLSTSLHHHQQFQAYNQNSRQCSSCANHPSIEMELIYDLRRHMEQLHYELLELQKSTKTCTKMQVKLLHSIKQEVSEAVSHLVRGKDNTSMPRPQPRNGYCCVCYEKQIDSLLYRCGHMCTCLRCAHELQWSSKKCPVCRAPIVDVVRVYTHS